MPGTYQVTYDVTDAAGNAAITVTRTVTYEDRTPPVISLVGDDPLVLPMGSVYTDPGATALHRTPWPAKSTAMDLARPISPCLDVE